MKSRKRKAVLWISVVLAFSLAIGLMACTNDTEDEDEGSAEDVATEATEDAEDEAAESDDVDEASATPEEDEYGVITAEEWAEIYPLQYASYLENAENSPDDTTKHDYLELYPALTTMYSGYAFALGYDEASSHLYSLVSVTETPRTTQKSQLANCITCKSPQYTALVNSEGDSVYSLTFDEVITLITEPVSCYNCHENDPETLTITASYWIDSLGDDIDEVDLSAAVCGQCHCEYYFDSETKATTNPYTGLDEMTPDSILAYYDSIDYYDWLYPTTETPMIKVQHPEFETLYGGDGTYMTTVLGYTCADCHMGTTTSEDGEEYTSHYWVSPLENEELLETCNTCHTDLAAEVAAIQEEEEERVQEISEKIVEMIELMTAQVEDGTLTGDLLEEVQYLHRAAQFYWDFVMVENSEGAHNPDLTTETLDKAEAAVDEAIALLEANASA